MAKKQDSKKQRPSSTGGPGPRNVDQTNWRKQLQQNRIKFDDDAKEVFLGEFEQHGRIGTAAKAAGVCIQTVRDHIKNDTDFGEAYAEAKMAYRDKVHETAYNVAVEGTDEPIIGGKNKDRVVAHKRVYATNILLAELKRVDPDYKERSEVDVNAKGGVLLMPQGLSMEEALQKFGGQQQEQEADDGSST